MNASTLRPLTIIAASGSLLLLGAAFHIAVWLYLGGSLEGSVSWRKPVLFCLASGVTCLSIAWVAHVVRPLPGDTMLAAIFSAAILGEVGLICMQQWRGVPSHFNRATEFDAGALLTLKALVTAMTVAIVIYAVRVFGKLNVGRDYAVATRVGMVLLVVSCLLGFMIEIQGEARAERGNDPTTFGAAGVLKFPHGVPMHAIQILPVGVYLLRRWGASWPLRIDATAGLSVAIVGFTCFSLLQTYGGRARFDMTPVSTLILLASGLACFAWLPRVIWNVFRAEAKHEIHA